MSISSSDWESVFRVSRDMVVLINADTYNVIQATSSILDVFSLTSEDVVNKYIWDAFTPLTGSNIEKQMASFEKVKETKRPDVQERMRFDATRDGIVTERYWISSQFPVIEKGVVKFILIYADDVTSLVHLERLALSMGKVGESLLQAVEVIFDVKIRVGTVDFGSIGDLSNIHALQRIDEMAENTKRTMEE